MIRGIVTSVIEGLIKILNATGRSGETFQEREYFQHYGFTSRPLPGAEVIIINEGNHYLGIASDDRRYRLAIDSGEVSLYTDEGDKIHLMRNKTIEIVSGNKLIATVENEAELTTKVAKVAASESCEVTSAVVTVNASESCTVTSPEITANAATSCVVESPIIILGNQEITRYLVDERIIALFNTHTHEEGGSVPVQQISAESICTAITKAA